MSFIRKVQNDQLVIQLNELIQDYPSVLKYKMDSKSFPSKKEGTNKICIGCNKKESELKLGGHSKNCIYALARQRYDYIFSYLTRYEKDNLELILQEINS
jgi:hypothetical protein